MKPFFVAAMLFGLAASPLVGQRGTPVPDPRSELPAEPKPASVRDGFTLTSIGELLYSHPMAATRDTALQDVFKLIRTGDVTIGDQEASFHDKATFTGSGYGESLLLGEAGIASDEKALGVRMVTLANNHGTDWGPEGLIETQRLLKAAGIATAGGGRNRTEAFAPAYYQTMHGRVALVGVASTFKTYSDANDATDESPARPGIAALRTRRVNLVAPDVLAELRSVVAKLNNGRAGSRGGSGTVSLGGQLYRVSDTPGVQYEMNTYDESQILKSIRTGKQDADFAIFTIHAHETGSSDVEDTAIPSFLVQLFHDAVDAGADVVMGHGPHFLRGIEIYRGKPIFYGLGAFFLSGDIFVMGNAASSDAYPEQRQSRSAASGSRAVGAIAPPPGMRTATPGGNPAQWYDGIVVSTTFDGNHLKEIRLYPLDLGNTNDLKRRGLPHFASPENSRRILEKLQSLSARFGTKIDIEGTVGVIRPK